MGALMHAALEKAIGDPGGGLVGSGVSVLGGPQQVKRRSRAALLKLYETHHWVRLALDVIAGRQSAAEWFLMLPEQSSRGRAARRKIMNAPPDIFALQKPQGSSARTKAIEVAKAEGAVREINDHPYLTMRAQGTAGAPAWLELPGYEVDKLRRNTLDLVGEWIQILFRDPVFGHPVRQWPVPPVWVTPPTARRSAFEVRVRGGSPDYIPPEDVSWYRQPKPLDPYDGGTGRGEALDHELQQDESMAAYLTALLRNRARPDLLIAMKGLGPTQEERFESKFRQATTGSNRAGVSHFVGMPLATADGSPVDLKGDFIQVHDLSKTPADLEVTETRRDKRDVVLQVLGVPQNVIGATESSNRATAYQGEISVRENRTIPDLEAERNADQYRFFESRGGRDPEYPGGWILGYRLPPLLDVETQVALLKSGPGNFTENDWRSVAGMRKSDEGDNRRWIRSDLIAVENDDIGSLMEIFRGEGP